MEYKPGLGLLGDKRLLYRPQTHIYKRPSWASARWGAELTRDLWVARTALRSAVGLPQGTGLMCSDLVFQ